MRKQLMQIPKIDISGIEDKEFSKPLLQEFFSAYNEYGFGYIINHGIDKNLDRATFPSFKKFSLAVAIRKNESSA